MMSNSKSIARLCAAIMALSLSLAACNSQCPKTECDCTEVCQQMPMTPPDTADTLQDPNAPMIPPPAEMIDNPADAPEPDSNINADAAIPGSRPNSNAERDTIPEDKKWNTSRLFADVAAWQASLDSLSKEITKLNSCEDFKGKDGKLNAEALENCLNLYFDLHTNINKVTLFASMQNDTISTPETAQRHQTALKLHNTFMESSEKLRNAILALTQADVDQFVAARPDAAKYKVYMNGLIRRAKRILSPDAERVLRLAGDNLWAEIDLNEIPSNSETVFNAMLDEMNLPEIPDEYGLPVQLNLANYSVYRKSQDRDVRKAAVNALFGTLYSYRDVFASAYIGQVKTDVLFAQARNYPTALEAYMDKDNIDTSVYYNLIKKVNENLEPLHRYVKLRKELLELDKVHFYDLYIPMTESVEKNYSYEDAVQIIKAALTPLGEDYAQKLSKALDPKEGSIDLLPHKNKRSGAYSASVYGVDPFVLINYQNSLDDVSTLAHEIGHAIHSSYSMENQSAATFHYTSFIAEIASTTNEALLSDYLLKNAQTDAEKIQILVQKLENIRATIYRQALFAEFELASHTAIENGESIDAEWLQKKYGELVQKYYGAEDYAFDELDGFEWSYIPHFYWKYYVYTYATGLSSALAFAKRIQESPENAAKYIDMLKSGCNDSPVSLLLKAGVDLNAQSAEQNPVSIALSEFNSTIDELESLIKK